MPKPFRTIREQVGILSSRGLATDERTAGILEREGYYCVVNGYKDPFIDREATGRAGRDEYARGAAFEDVYRLFRFDRDLRLVMFRYFAQAEAVLKTTCAMVTASRHADEPEFYLERSSYRGEQRYDDRVGRLVDDFARIAHRHPYEGRPFKREYIEHYVRDHGELPIWVLANYLMLGQAFKFFEYQPEDVRNEIAREFSWLYGETHPAGIRVSPRRLRLAYDHIKDFRNICAHDERLYCARVSPSRDITFRAMLDDLEIVLSRDEHSRMLREVMGLLMGLTSDLDGDVARHVTTSMGIDDVASTFMPMVGRRA